MPLSNLFSNKLDDLINSSNKKDIINRRQNKNAINSQLLAIGRNKVINHSESKKQIEGIKKDTFDISFFYHRIIKCN